MATATGRFTVVKFVPDSVRFEPVNVGIVVETVDDIVTRMADSVDPRIRFADPYVDMKSLVEFLNEFDAAKITSEGPSVVAHLTNGSTSIPNFFFDLPRSIDATQLSAEQAADVLYDRLVRRSFESPPGFVRPQSPTAARTALRKAFQSQRLIGSRVRSAVRTTGRSGVEWDMDFEYLADELVFVQTATTGLKEDLRRREHAFSAFSALVDTTTEPGVRGLLASDESPERDEISGLIASMASAHGFEFVGGQRAFVALALRVRDTARELPQQVSPTDVETRQLSLLA